MTRRAWRPPVGMAEAVAATLDRLGLGAGVKQREVWRIWHSVVGPQIARHAQPAAVIRGRLVVHVTDPVWLQQLSLMRHRLLASLHKALGESAIREIVLRIGEAEAVTSSSPGSPPPELPLDPARHAEIQELTSLLGDAPCRDALEHLMLRASRSPGPSKK